MDVSIVWRFCSDRDTRTAGRDAINGLDTDRRLLGLALVSVLKVDLRFDGADGSAGGSEAADGEPSPSSAALSASSGGGVAGDLADRFRLDMLNSDDIRLTAIVAAGERERQRRRLRVMQQC